MAASLSLESGRYLVLWPVDADGSPSPLLLPDLHAAKPSTSGSVQPDAGLAPSNNSSAEACSGSNGAAEGDRDAGLPGGLAPQPEQVPDLEGAGDTVEAWPGSTAHTSGSSGLAPQGCESSSSSGSSGREAFRGFGSSSGQQQGSEDACVTDACQPSGPDLGAEGHVSSRGMGKPSGCKGGSSWDGEHGSTSAGGCHSGGKDEGPGGQEGGGSSAAPAVPSMKDEGPGGQEGGGSSAAPAGPSMKRCVIDPYGCGGLLEIEEVRCVIALPGYQ